MKERIEGSLKWAEQYTKTDMVYLAHGGFWTISAQAITTVTTLLLAMAFAHFIPKETYGEYKFILSIASILGAFTLTGLGTAVTKYVAQGFDGTMNEAFWINIRWSALFIILSLGASIYYFINGNRILGIAMLVTGSLSPIWNSTNIYNSYLIGKKDFKRSSIYFSIIGNIFPSLCLSIALLFHSSTLILITVYFLSNTIIGLILYLRVLKIYKPNDKTDKGAFGYSKHLSLMGILGTITDNVDQVLVFHYVGPVQLAIYNFAIAIPNQIKGPLKGLAGLMFPKFAERSDREIVSGMKNKYLIMFISSIIIIIVYVVLAPYIFHIFFPKYVDSILYSQIFVFYFLGIISSPAEVYLISKGKIKEQYIAAIFGSVIQIILLFLGLIYWGILGLVIARVITKLIWSSTNILLYKNVSRKALQKI